MNDDELITGNDRADRLLQQIRSLGEGPAPTPQRELSRLLAGHRRPPHRRLWLVGGLSAVVIAGGATTSAAAAHGLVHPWAGALGGIVQLWSDAPASAEPAAPLTGSALARAGRTAGLGGAAGSPVDALAPQDPSAESVTANRPAPGSGTTRPAHGGEHPPDTGSDGTTGDHAGDGGGRSGDEADGSDKGGGDAADDAGSDASDGAGSGDGSDDGTTGGSDDGADGGADGGSDTGSGRGD